MKKHIDWEKVASLSDVSSKEKDTSQSENASEIKEETRNLKNSTFEDNRLLDVTNGIIENPSAQPSQSKEENYINLGDVGESLNVDTTIKSNKKGLENKDNVVLSPKDYKKKYNPKYEKSKFRPLNFLATILAVIALIVAAVGIVGFIIYASLGLFGSSMSSAGSSFFNDKAVAFSLGLSGVFGVIIYIIIGLVILLISALAIPLFINGIKILIYGFKVNNIRDADYYKNVFVKTIIRYSIFNAIISAVYIILTIMFKYKFFSYFCIAGVCAYAVVTVVYITAYFVNISRFKKKASPEELSKAEQNAKEAADYVKMHNFHYGRRKRRRGRIFR